MLSSEAIHQSTKLTLSILGNLTLEDDLGNHIKISNRKACGLLAYLAINGTSTETRERLAGLLWSDRGEEQARASLRQCLKQLRTIFDDIGFTGFETDRQDVSLAPGRISIDIQTIVQDLENGSVPKTLLTEGCEPHKILYGFESLDQSFAAWLHVIRQNWHDRLVDHLQRILRNNGETSAKWAADALVKIDPTHEEAHRHLIRHHANDGNTTSALNQYKTLWNLLDEEFDMEPDEDTQSLIVEIKAGTYVPAANPDDFPFPPQSVAIVPIASQPDKIASAARLPVIGISRFSRGGPWTKEEYLIDGFRHELTAALARFREWTVVEGNALLTQPSMQAPQSYSRVQSADYQLEGVYYEDCETVHQVITLRDTATQQYIWSERIELTPDKWFDARRKIVRRIAVALNIYISVERLTRVASKPDVSLDIYDRWLRGQALHFQWRPEAGQEASEVFRSIIEDAPSFAPAYSSLVQIENTSHLEAPGVFRSAERESKTLALAKTAVQIDPVDTKTQLCLAWSRLMNRHYDQALINFRLAYDLNQNDPWTIVSAAMGLAFCGSYHDAKGIAAQALNLDFNPSQSHWLYQSNIAFLRGDYEAAVMAGEKAGSITVGCVAWRAAALSILGRTAEARKVGREFMALAKEYWADPLPADDAAIGRWVMDAYPIADQEAMRRLRDGLIAAGVPAA